MRILIPHSVEVPLPHIHTPTHTAEKMKITHPYSVGGKQGRRSRHDISQICSQKNRAFTFTEPPKSSLPLSWTECNFTLMISEWWIAFSLLQYFRSGREDCSPSEAAEKHTMVFSEYSLKCFLLCQSCIRFYPRHNSGKHTTIHCNWVDVESLK